MESINRLLAGVHADNDPRFRPEDSMRSSLNGTILSIGNNRFAWRPMGSTELLFSLDTDQDYIAHCLIKGGNIKPRLFILAHDFTTDVSSLIEVLYDADMNTTAQLRWSHGGNIFDLDLSHPVRSMIGFYETESIQRIYFTDYNSQPRVINVGNGTTVTVSEKFSKFYPEIEKSYGNFSFIALLDGGNTKAGNYFFCWQLYNDDGYFTDWSYLTNPIHITGSPKGSNSLFEYQRHQGQAPDYNTQKALYFRIANIDTDYSSIRIAAFYSNDYNSAGPGMIFFDSGITGEVMEVIYYGGENLGTVLIDDLVNHSTVIEQIKEMRIIKKMNAIAAIKERGELDLSSLPGGKNSQMQVDIAVESYQVVLDVTGSEKTGSDNNEQALFASPHVIYDRVRNILRAGIWYKVTSSTNCVWSDGVLSYSHTPGERFKPHAPGWIGSGAAVPIIRRKLYSIKS